MQRRSVELLFVCIEVLRPRQQYSSHFEDFVSEFVGLLHWDKLHPKSCNRLTFTAPVNNYLK